MPTASDPKPRDLAISLEDVSVHFEGHKTPTATLKEWCIRWLHRDLQKEYLRGLNNLSLDVAKGEAFAILGRNGAGKSTLLRVISGILHPTLGRARVWGRVSSLLGVGAGFHGDLSGRENVYLYSAILGRSAQRTRELFDEIVEFAELADFIDAPLRVYSSGMAGRLGFAVAIAEQPDILLVDEVLGVGDEQFRQKCQKRFKEIQDAGTTIVMVTHNLTVAQTMCDRAAWIMNGSVVECGESTEVVTRYREYQTQAKHTSTIRPR